MSFSLTRAAPVGPKRNTVQLAGDTNRRWNRSRWTPVKWATAALMGSACETATTSSPGWAATISSRLVMIRDCISRTDSPWGKRTAEGVVWTSFHRSLLRRSSIFCPVQSP